MFQRTPARPRKAKTSEIFPPNRKQHFLVILNSVLKIFRFFFFVEVFWFWRPYDRHLYIFMILVFYIISDFLHNHFQGFFVFGCNEVWFKKTQNTKQSFAFFLFFVFFLDHSKTNGFLHFLFLIKILLKPWKTIRFSVIRKTDTLKTNGFLRFFFLFWL